MGNDIIQPLRAIQCYPVHPGRKLMNEFGTHRATALTAAVATGDTGNKRQQEEGH
jgi:hypothetical protein